MDLVFKEDYLSQLSVIEVTETIQTLNFPSPFTLNKHIVLWHIM